MVWPTRRPAPLSGALGDDRAGTTRPAAPRGYRSVLANREFLGLLISRVVSLVGDQLARVALTVLVFSRTGSPLLSAATYAATFLPAVIGGPLLGGLADRLPRRRLLVFTDLLRGGLFALMAVPGLPLTVLLALVLVATTVEAPWSAARAPLMRDILIDDDGYQLGTGLDEALNDSGQVVGFAAAGALLVVFSTSAALLLDAVSFGVSAVAVRLLVRQRAAAGPGRPAGAPGSMRRRWTSRVDMALSDARLGLRAATAPSCRRPLLLTWAGISCSIAPEALAAPWGRSLGAGSLGVGLLYAAGPAGSVVGFLLAGRASAEVGRRLLLPLALLALLPLVVCLAGPPLPCALALVGVSGVGTSYSLLARVAFVRGGGRPLPRPGLRHRRGRRHGRSGSWHRGCRWRGRPDQPRVRGRPDRRTGPGAGGGRAARLAPHRCGRTDIYGRRRSVPRLRLAFLKSCVKPEPAASHAQGWHADHRRAVCGRPITATCAAHPRAV